MNKGSKYKSGQRPTFRIWDNEKNDWFEPTYEGWDGKIEELLLSPTGDLTMRTFTDFKHESVFPERFEIVLDEPQKVKVPLFVAKWISKCRELNWILPDLLAPEAFESNFARDTEEWLRQDKQNYDILARAWLDGYEVEEEPKWKIINDQKYCLTSIEAGYGNSLHWAFDSTKKKPILFDNEETALHTAYITGGTVEKV